MLGTNFSLMVKLFPNWNHNNLKDKFKNEEKTSSINRQHHQVLKYNSIIHIFLVIKVFFSFLFFIILFIFPAFIPAVTVIFEQPSNSKTGDSDVPSTSEKKANAYLTL